MIAWSCGKKLALSANKQKEEGENRCQDIQNLPTLSIKRKKMMRRRGRSLRLLAEKLQSNYLLFTKLATVVAKAKANNMPNDTIERGIKKAAGDVGNVNYEYVTYEGYGPNGIAIIVDALTDNKNRTAANVRSAFTKGQGNVGTPGCVSFMFDRKGQIIIDREECEIEADDLMMTALDAGAEDFSEEEDSYEVLTDPDQFEDVRRALEDAGIPMMSAEVTMIPQNYVQLSDETAVKNLQKTLDLLDDDDDVQAVYHNWDEE